MWGYPPPGRDERQGVSRLVTSDSLWPYGLCPWKSPGKNTGAGKPFPSPGFLTQGWNPGLPSCRQILHHLSYLGARKGNLLLIHIKVYRAEISLLFLLILWRKPYRSHFLLANVWLCFKLSGFLVHFGFQAATVYGYSSFLAEKG